MNLLTIKISRLWKRLSQDTRILTVSFIFGAVTAFALFTPTMLMLGALQAPLWLVFIICFGIGFLQGKIIQANLPQVLGKFV